MISKKNIMKKEKSIDMKESKKATKGILRKEIALDRKESKKAVKKKI